MNDTLATCSPERTVLISGPTASGKSALALELAARQGRSVINADALQVFDGWHILTARPGDDDCAIAPHLLYGHVDFRATYSVGDWLRDVAPLLTANPAPVIVGGTGLYFRALLAGLADIPATAPEIRTRAGQMLAEDGLSAMIGALDSETRSRIDLQNPVRVQRAWEVLTQTGRGLAAWQDDTGPPLLREDQTDRFVVAWDRDRLAERISRRFDQMLTTGLWEEVARMEPLWDPKHQSSRAIGAAEMIAAFRNEMPISEAISAAKTATRQYAKRQRTWLRSKMSNWTRVLTDM